MTTSSSGSSGTLVSMMVDGLGFSKVGVVGLLSREDIFGAESKIVDRVLEYCRSR